MSLDVVARPRWCHSVVVVARANSSSSSSSNSSSSRSSTSNSTSGSAGVDVVVVGCARDRAGKGAMVSSACTGVRSDCCSSSSSLLPSLLLPSIRITNNAVSCGTAAVIAPATDRICDVAAIITAVFVVIASVISFIAAAVAAVIVIAVVDAAVSPATAITATISDASMIVVRAANEASIATV
ncbi:hypothetical protein DMN91_006314 [Ooceraea biroi]|uniref:Uncharacterized protein n=1 Tax=Ooceraea biroi TaxID=2015173 RepID=A0A3L8DNB9_OOCBI|nr:uncharacterized serine-rich protein C1E8.05-like [Ooceraea biroi]RLU21935.1 hypothetical protein DMN91_006314 [Ooceraea biroi]